MDVTVVNATTTGAGTQYRIVTDTPPEDATVVDPNLEDGYMALTISKENS